MATSGHDTEALEGLAWLLYCKDTEGDVDVRDDWKSVPVEDKTKYVLEALSLGKEEESSDLPTSAEIGGDRWVECDAFTTKKEEPKTTVDYTKLLASSDHDDDDLEGLAWLLYCKESHGHGIVFPFWSILPMASKYQYLMESIEWLDIAASMKSRSRMYY